MNTKITKNRVTGKKNSSKVADKGWHFNLYIAGQTPHCMLTLANLKNFCNQYLQDQYEITVTDLLLHPERAQTDEIIAIPTIIKLRPDPKRYIIGDFADHELMLLKLGINTGGKMDLR